MTLGPRRCTGTGQGQGPDSTGNSDRTAQTQESKIVLMVLTGTLVAGVRYRQGSEPQLFRPVQLGEAVFPEAHHVPEGMADQWVVDRLP